MIKTWKDLLSYLSDDVYRYSGKRGISNFLKYYFSNIRIRYIVWFRISQYLSGKNKLIYFVFRSILEHYAIKCIIEISPKTQIGSGLYFPHSGCIMIHPDAVIGKNAHISHEVTIGKDFRGKKAGAPMIGDNVYIAPGVKIIGKIKIGNNVAIGANAVVLNDVPDNAVVVGIPGKVVSYKGNKEYVKNLV